MNEQYQRFIDSYNNDKMKNNARFYFERLNKNNINISSETVTTLEQLEKVFVVCGINTLNNIIGFRSVLKSYTVFINDKALFNLVRKLDIYKVLEKIKPNIKHTYISSSEFQDIYNAIGVYDENTFSYNALYYKSLFRSIYEGIYCEDMSVLKNLRASDIDGNSVTMRDDNGSEWKVDVSKQLATDLIILANDKDPDKNIPVWYRNNRNGQCKIPIEGLCYDSVFRVETRKYNSKYAYRSGYYVRLRKISEEYIGYFVPPKNLFLSGIINRIKEQYEKSDEEFVLGIQNSDPLLVEIYTQEAKRCNYSVGFWNFRQTVSGRI